VASNRTVSLEWPVSPGASRSVIVTSVAPGRREANHGSRPSFNDFGSNPELLGI
jgi:hypothetical protein